MKNYILFPSHSVHGNQLYFGVLLVYSALFQSHSTLFRHIPVHSVPFHSVPFFSIPFLCLVTPPNYIIFKRNWCGRDIRNKGGVAVKNINISSTFLFLCPYCLTIKLNFNILKNAYSPVAFPTRGDAHLGKCLTNRLDLFGKSYQKGLYFLQTLTVLHFIFNRVNYCRMM